MGQLRFLNQKLGKRGSRRLEQARRRRASLQASPRAALSRSFGSGGQTGAARRSRRSK